MSIKDTLKERGSRYGTIIDNSNCTQGMLKVLEEQSSGYMALPDVHKECVHMILHKIARMCNGDPMYNDNAHDIAGYAVLLKKYIDEVNEAMK